MPIFIIVDVQSISSYCVVGPYLLVNVRFSTPPRKFSHALYLERFQRRIVTPALHLIYESFIRLDCR